MSDRKDNMISFWRIVFTYGVVLFHLFNQYEHWTGWDIGVEFFFVVSGWLLAADLKKYNRTPYGYTLHRIKRLYPEYFIVIDLVILFISIFLIVWLESILLAFITPIKALYNSSPIWFSLQIILTLSYFGIFIYFPPKNINVILLYSYL